jgi:GT2 family glycosyltransferase/glycosyltransferase involved in cell wall biosynthesis
MTVAETEQYLAEAERTRTLAYFDPAWYGRTYEHDGLDTAALESHFLETGIWQGCDPGPLFSSAIYNATNRRAAFAEDLPAFVHYIRHGCLERRRPNPVFNPHVYAYFLESPDSIPDLFAHFLHAVKRGGAPTFSVIIPADFAAEVPDIPAREVYARLFDAGRSLVGLLPKCVFRPNFYRRVAGVLEHENELYDYLLDGWRKGHDPHPLFDGGYYLEMLEKSETLNHHSLGAVSPLEHFIDHWDEAPSPSPFFDAQYYNHEAALPETHYRNPLEAFCAMDERFKFIAPHRKVNFEALGHSVQDSLTGDGKPFEASSFLAIISALRFEGLDRAGERLGDAAEEPLISILTLNYHNLEHTILAAFMASRDAEGMPHEILVLDNGSGNWAVHQLRRYLGNIPHIRVIASERNTYFGEGNNLLIDEARGKYLMFLNNDAYLGKGNLKTLTDVLERDASCGMVCPTLLFPDGRIQEEGGSAHDCGTTTQYLKHLPYREFIANRKPAAATTAVEYVSAAASVTRTDLIREIGGFDLLFEPLFYEDTDLCRRIRAHGLSVCVSHEAFTVHLENTSTRDFLGDGFTGQILANKYKYADRWLRRPEGSAVPRAGSDIERFSASAPNGKPRAVIYTPFPLTVGGGERYILSVAAALTDEFDVTFALPCPTSRTRLAFVMDDLGLNARFALAHWDSLDLCSGIDLFIAMGNEITPPVAAVGRRNIYHCQFPFPLHRVEGRHVAHLTGYDRIVVNSAFTRTHTERALKNYGYGHIPVTVVHPPVKTNASEAAALYHSDAITLSSVGRYITREHMKRQDVVVETLRMLTGSGVVQQAHIAGALSAHADDVAFYEKLKADAPRFASVEANVSRARIEAILGATSIYMHATGYGMSPAVHPHYMEHFGITIVEAMSYGAVPLVFAAGGPVEIVEAAGVGYTFRTTEEAAACIRHFAALPEAERQIMAQKAFKAAQGYGEARFAAEWLETAKT